MKINKIFLFFLNIFYFWLLTCLVSDVSFSKVFIFYPWCYQVSVLVILLLEPTFFEIKIRFFISIACSTFFMFHLILIPNLTINELSLFYFLKHFLLFSLLDNLLHILFLHFPLNILFYRTIVILILFIIFEFTTKTIDGIQLQMMKCPPL